MKYNKSLSSTYFLYCYLAVVYAADEDLSEMENKIQPNSPGIGNISNEVAVYSNVRGRMLNKVIDTQFKNIQSKIGMNSEADDLAAYLKLDKGGIKVYIYKHRKSVFATFRAITHIDASIESILAVILDINSTTKWVDSCEKSFMIKKISFNEQYHYQIFYIPFPFQNRDFILHSTMIHDPLSNTMTITMSADADYCQDKQSTQCQQVNQSELVRVNKSVGTFKLEPDKQGTRITWIQHTNPAGSLPSWLVNQLIKNIAYRSLKKLEAIAKEKQYKEAKLLYDANGIAIAFEIKKSVNIQ